MQLKVQFPIPSYELASFLLKLLEVLPTLPLCTFLLGMHPALGAAASISSDSKLNGIEGSNGKDDFKPPVGAMRRLNRVR